MKKFYVTKTIRQDFHIEVEAESENAAKDLVRQMDEFDLNDDGRDVEYDAEEIEE